jgi:hypothetical protein
LRGPQQQISAPNTPKNKVKKPDATAEFSVTIEKKEIIKETELNMNFKQAVQVVRKIMNMNDITVQLDEENVEASFNLLADIQSLTEGDTNKTIKLDAKGKFIQFLHLCIRKKTQLSLPIRTFLPLI